MIYCIINNEKKKVSIKTGGSTYARSIYTNIVENFGIVTKTVYCVKTLSVTAVMVGSRITIFSTYSALFCHVSHLLGYSMMYPTSIQLQYMAIHSKVLNVYKRDWAMTVNNLQSLLNEPIQWNLLEKHYADRMRTAMTARWGKLPRRRFGAKNRER